MPKIRYTAGKRLKELEKKNARLKHIVAEQALDIVIFKKPVRPHSSLGGRYPERQTIVPNYQSSLKNTA